MPIWSRYWIFFFYPYKTCHGSKGRQYGNNCLLFRTVELGREPVGLQLQGLLSPKRAVCNGRRESPRLGYESEGSPSLAGTTVSATELSPACRWHWGSACSPCIVPASEALAWYSQFHPAGSGHAYVQFLRSTASEARPSCSATASCTRADSLSPTRKQRQRQVSPKSCHPKPIICLVVFGSVTRRELFLIPPPLIPMAGRLAKFSSWFWHWLTWLGGLQLWVYFALLWNEKTIPNLPLSESRKRDLGLRDLWKYVKISTHWG